MVRYLCIKNGSRKALWCLKLRQHWVTKQVWSKLNGGIRLLFVLSKSIACPLLNARVVQVTLIFRAAYTWMAYIVIKYELQWTPSVSCTKNYRFALETKLTTQITHTPWKIYLAKNTHSILDGRWKSAEFHLLYIAMKRSLCKGIPFSLGNSSIDLH